MSTIIIMFISLLYSCICVLLIEKIFINLVKIEQPELFRFIFFSFALYSIYGYLISIITSTSKCNKRRHLKSIKYGFKLGLYIIITYLIIYFVSSLREPFTTLFNKNGELISKMFFLGLINLLTSTVIAYDSDKIICELTPKEIRKNLSELDKFLNKKDRRKKNKKIVIKD